MENVTARMDDEEIDLLDRLAEERGGSRSEAIRAAVQRGAREELVRAAIEQYRDGEVGIRGAADIANLSIAEMMREANERGVLLNYDVSELADDVDALR
ncbi:UPF0175 family protein [Halobaculum sp. MBLA0143]|uniref:UPF0175 family protein n=1 Tax=Halobaculum sp. MBLA0143 TaxID=3079933 RepID=UPI0035261938